MAETMKDKVIFPLLFAVSVALFSWNNAFAQQTEENLSQSSSGNKARTALTKGGMEQLDSLEYVYKYQSNLNNLLYKTIHRNKDGVIILGLSKTDAKSLGISEELYDLVQECIERRNKE